MSKKFYICRTNQSNDWAFDEVLRSLDHVLPEASVSYYDKNNPSTVSVTDVDVVIVIPTFDGTYQGYIGKGVEKQIDQAKSAGIPVWMYNEDDDRYFDFNDEDLIVYISSGNDWNRTVNVDWSCVAEFDIWEAIDTMEASNYFKTTNMKPRKVYEVEDSSGKAYEKGAEESKTPERGVELSFLLFRLR